MFWSSASKGSPCQYIEQPLYQVFLYLFFICWWFRCIPSCLKTLVRSRIWKRSFNTVIPHSHSLIPVNNVYCCSKGNFEHLWFLSLFLIEGEKILMLNMSSMKGQQYVGSLEPQSFLYPVQIQELETWVCCLPSWVNDVLFAAGQASSHAKQWTVQDLLSGVSRGSLNVLYFLLYCETLNNT